MLVVVVVAVFWLYRFELCLQLGLCLRKMVEKEMKAAKAPSETEAPYASFSFLAEQGHPGANAVRIPKF